MALLKWSGRLLGSLLVTGAMVLPAFASKTTITAAPPKKGIYGDSFSVTAKVALEDGETGTLASAIAELVMDGSKTIGSEVISLVDGSDPTVGTVTFTVSPDTDNLPGAGGHKLKVRFRADLAPPGMESSESKPVSYTVAPRSTTTVLTAPARLAYGSGVTLQVKVGTAIAGLNADAGSVIFYRDSSKLGTVAVGSDGTAKLVLDTFPFGEFKLKAAYKHAGKNFRDSTSATQRINADFRAGDEVVVNTTTGRLQQHPAAAGFAPVTGRALVVWQSKGPGSATQIYGRMVGQDGTFVTGEILIASAVGAENPAVVQRGNGNFMVAWQQGSSLKRDIYWRQVNFDGKITDAGPFLLNADSTGGDQTDVALSASSDGSIIAAVYKSRSTDNDVSIAGRLFRPDSSIYFTANTTDAAPATTPAVSLMSFGQFAVAWSSPVTGGFIGKLQRLSTVDASKIGSEVDLDKVKAALPAVSLGWRGIETSVDGSTDGVLVGIDGVEAPTKSARDVKVTAIDTKGKFLIGFKKADFRSGDQNSITLTGLVSNAGTAAWVGPDASKSGIWVQAASLPYTGLREAFPANTTTAGVQSEPVIAVLGKGAKLGSSYLVVWTSIDTDGASNIYMQRVVTP